MEDTSNLVSVQFTDALLDCIGAGAMAEELPVTEPLVDLLIGWRDEGRAYCEHG